MAAGCEDRKRKPRWKDRMPTAQSGAAPARVPQASVGSMPRSAIQDLADKRVLHLTTIGRRMGLPREIEIWFVVHGDRFYLFAETGEAAAWVIEYPAQSHGFGPNRGEHWRDGARP
jgi:hypothetical protein